MKRLESVIIDNIKFAINEQTHALDLSAVYGKDLEISDALRLFKDGKL